MAKGLDNEANDKPVYEKPVLVCYGSLQETTRTVNTPLPGEDLLPAVDLYGDPS